MKMKIARNICAIFLAFSLCLVSSANPEPNLNALFAEYNKAYFSNYLPESTTVVWIALPDSMLAQTLKEEGRFRIEMNRRLVIAPKFTSEVLLHEQCHIATWDEPEKHGKRWFSCMHRLVEEGAFEDLF